MKNELFSRRKFLLSSALTSAGIITSKLTNAEEQNPEPNELERNHSNPVVISTWKHGLPANEAAWKILKPGGNSLDAVETGVKVTEADPKSTSVGLGGTPDSDGNVTLDACIMNPEGDCGAVSYLQNIKHPISVARKVMEQTPHVMLSGKGALDFAISQGFKKEILLTKKSKLLWKKWKKEKKYRPVINVENHDTIGMLAMDKEGNISGACTTSGLGYKLPGRVGDSPIIGAGLYVDNEVGGAVATGLGEAVIKIVGSFLVVELMRNGMTPEFACKEAIKRIVNKQDFTKMQVGFLALNRKGKIGSFAIRKGFAYAVYRNGENELLDSNFYVK